MQILDIFFNFFYLIVIPIFFYKFYICIRCVASNSHKYLFYLFKLIMLIPVNFVPGRE